MVKPVSGGECDVYLIDLNLQKWCIFEPPKSSSFYSDKSIIFLIIMVNFDNNVELLEKMNELIVYFSKKF